MFYQVSLDDLVSPDNYYRKLSQSLDLQFVYKATSSYYGKEGQESIDPAVFFKMLLVGYLNNINSDRRLVEFCSNCLDVRLFLKYDLDAKLPWHSTISRTRQLYGEEVFLSLFREVLRMCVQKGMVAGKMKAFDSAFVKANASMESLVEKEVVEDAVAYANELDEGSEYKVSAERKKRVERHHAWKKAEYKGMPASDAGWKVDENGNTIRPKYLSNHTHYSPTDPDARVSVKPGKARQLNYSGQLAVDAAHHVITGACASSAGNRDSQNLAEILAQTIDNLKDNDLDIDQVAADTGYSSGEALKFCEEHQVDAYIPNHGQYKHERVGFVYNREKDRYECVQVGGNKALLPYKGMATDKQGYTRKSYRSSEKDCGHCPLVGLCCGKSTRFKKLDESIHKPYYDRMHEKLAGNPTYAKRMSRIRSRTVEPVLGTLVNFLNMKKINSRGMAQANKHVLMAALAYNLKKYLKFVRKETKSAAMEVGLETQNKFYNILNVNCLIGLFVRKALVVAKN